MVHGGCRPYCLLWDHVSLWMRGVLTLCLLTALVEGCHATYNSTATMIGPEQFSWNTSTIMPDQADFYDSSGYYITNPSYNLRPEVLESFYYAYRITGELRFLLNALFSPFYDNPNPSQAIKCIATGLGKHLLLSTQPLGLALGSPQYQTLTYWEASHSGMNKKAFSSLKS